MLESNIGLALYNRGRHEEAVGHLDKAIAHYWGKLPKNRFVTTCRALIAFVHFYVALYAPSLKFRRRLSEKDKEALALVYKKCTALATINPRRCFVEMSYLLRDLTRFDLSNFRLGLEILLSSSVVFSFTGISFRTSRKVLDLVEKNPLQESLPSVSLYALLKTTHNYFSGQWRAIEEYRPSLVEQDLAIGNTYYASQYLYWQGLARVYCGSLEQARSIIQRLNDLAEVYANDFSLFLKHNLLTILLRESQEFDAALAEVERGIRIAQEADFYLFLINLYSCKASIQTSMGDTKGVESSLLNADRIKSDVNPAPVQLSEFYRSHVHYDLHRLQESIRKADAHKIREYGHRAANSIRRLKRVTRRVAQHRTESHRLKGTSYWLTNKPRSAFRSWSQSIAEGERLGARLELAQTYLEVGKRLSEDGGKPRTFHGMGAEHLVDKAAVLFRQMGLERCIDECDRVTRAVLEGAGRRGTDERAYP
jgi:tetratricopeptide (TPR) repeat protein